MSRLISIAAALLPEPRRSIYREQWLADLRDSDEAGVSRSSIVAGALLFGATHHWAQPALEQRPSLLVHRGARRGLALLISAAVVGIGAYLTGAGPGASGAVLEFLTFFVSVLQVAIIAIALIGGLVSLAAVARHDVVVLFATVALSVGLAAGVVAVLLPGASFGLAVVAVLLLIGGTGGVGVRCLATVPSATGARMRDPRRSRRMGLIGLAAVVATVVVGTLDGLVWMPLALGPGLSLDAIYAAIRTDVWYSVGEIVVWAAVGLALGIALVPLSRVLPPRDVATLAMLVVTTGIFFSWFAAFGMGNAVSDAVPPYAGGESPVAPFYWFVGQVTLVGVILRTIAPRAVPAMSPA